MTSNEIQAMQNELDEGGKFLSVLRDLMLLPTDVGL